MDYKTLKIGIDLDDTINASKESITFFSQMTNALKRVARIYIITNRLTDDESRFNTKEELVKMGIYFSDLIITADKAEFIMKEGITVYFENTDEYHQTLPSSITVFKIREPGNFDFIDHKWIYGDKTGKNFKG